MLPTAYTQHRRQQLTSRPNGPTGRCGGCDRLSFAAYTPGPIVGLLVSEPDGSARDHRSHHWRRLWSVHGCALSTYEMVGLLVKQVGRQRLSRPSSSPPTTVVAHAFEHQPRPAVGGATTHRQRGIARIARVGATVRTSTPTPRTHMRICIDCDQPNDLQACAPLKGMTYTHRRCEPCRAARARAIHLVDPNAGMQAGPRICTSCGEARPESAFLPLKGTHWAYGRCRACRNARARARYRSSPEIRAADIDRALRNRPCSTATWRTADTCRR
jgi:hypothetical protein